MQVKARDRWITIASLLGLGGVTLAGVNSAMHAPAAKAKQDPATAAATAGKAAGGGSAGAGKDKPAPGKASKTPAQTGKIVKIVKTEAEWRKILTPQQFEVLRQKGTEPAFSGAYWNNHEKGTYVCAGCGLELFSSDTKFDSGTGWPSFWKPIAPQNVTNVADHSDGMTRTEVVCSRCGGHLGHVFDDGPRPTGLRYCMDSVSLKFIKAGK